MCHSSWWAYFPPVVALLGKLWAPWCCRSRRLWRRLVPGFKRNVFLWDVAQHPIACRTLHAARCMLQVGCNAPARWLFPSLLLLSCPVRTQMHHHARVEGMTLQVSTGRSRLCPRLGDDCIGRAFCSHEFDGPGVEECRIRSAAYVVAVMWWTRMRSLSPIALKWHVRQLFAKLTAKSS